MQLQTAAGCLAAGCQTQGYPVSVPPAHLVDEFSEALLHVQPCLGGALEEEAAVLPGERNALLLGHRPLGLLEAGNQSQEAVKQ